jgi:D-glycero-alpha-D-manno-heptose-7-phosphate kinase
MLTKAELARKAIFVEQEVLKENVGSQDQVCAAYGGLNLINFSRSGDVSVVPLTIGSQRIQRLEKHLMLFFTGISRESSQVQESFVKDINGRRRQLRVLTDLVEEGVQLLNGDFPLRDFGELLHESWELKRSLSESVSNPTIDRMYEVARGAGAIGGKVTGAGGGGFFLLFVEESRQAEVRDALRHCIHVPFHFEYGGSQIIFADQAPEYNATSELEIRARWEKLEEDLIHEQ